MFFPFSSLRREIPMEFVPGSSPNVLLMIFSFSFFQKYKKFVYLCSKLKDFSQ